MLERIRRRLTLGYVGIFALILLFIGVVAVASFARQAARQQDELLEQRAQGDADYVSGPLLLRYQEGWEPGEGPPPPGERGRRGESEGKGPPPGPFQWATDPDLGMVALVPGETDGEVGTVLDSTSSASSFGLPFEGPARRAAETGETVTETVDGPEGEMGGWRVSAWSGTVGMWPLFRPRSRAGWSGRRWVSCCSSWYPSA